MSSSSDTPTAATQEAALEKVHHRGTHRLRSPEATLAWVSPYLTKLGITRVADITGLDRIGIPVTMVVRPNSRSLAVSQGKGLDLTSARVSGIMESVETFHAERIMRELRLTSYDNLRAAADVVNVTRMARSRHSPFHGELRLLWLQGEDLISGKALWLPYEAVHTDYTWPRPTGSGCFPANTNGLASGNSLEEAMSHALCEVIERDALALWYQRGAYARDVVDLSDQTGAIDTDNQALIAKLHDAELDVRVWNATSDIGVACFNCLIIGRDEEAADPEFGSGCHPDRSIALSRALTEAVQARTTFIAGSRDDFGQQAYTDQARAERAASCRRLMVGDGGKIPFSQVPTFTSKRVRDDIDWLLERLIAKGIEEVVSVDLTLSEFGIPVARVVVPGLEGAYKGADSDYVPGARAKQWVRS